MISKISFPFIVFHDPTEQIVLVQGSKRLFEMSLTAEVNKSIVLVEGGLHDLLSNNFTLVTAKSIEWIQDQMTMTPESNRSFPSNSSDEQVKPCFEVLVHKRISVFYFPFFFVLGGLAIFTAVIRFKVLFSMINII